MDFWKEELAVIEKIFGSKPDIIYIFNERSFIFKIKNKKYKIIELIENFKKIKYKVYEKIELKEEIKIIFLKKTTIFNYISISVTDKIEVQVNQIGAKSSWL